MSAGSTPSRGGSRSTPQVTDPFGRHIENLRISITNRCNLRCIYCHMEGSWGIYRTPEMTPAEIERIVRASTRIGVRYLKITGGEPTLRPDLHEIIERTAPLVDEVSMTTNGASLEDLAEELCSAGLARVNISLDTLDPHTFERITSFPILERVVRGIHAASRVGIHPIKLNMVVLRRENSSRIWEMVGFARKSGITLQLIELHAPRELLGSDVFRSLYYPLDRIEADLERMSEDVVFTRMQRRKRFMLRGGGTVEVVRPQFNTEFCSHCYRLRLQADGRIRPCLMSQNGLTDILTPMRNGASDDDLFDLLRSTVRLRSPYWNPLEKGDIERLRARVLASCRAEE